MEFRLLGRVVADHDGVAVQLGRRRERCLLGLLLLNTGTELPVDRLTALLWEDDPPPSAPASLRTHASRLRRALRADDPGGGRGVRLPSRRSGYVIEADPLSVDAHRFRETVIRARRLTDPARRSAALRDALALWRGPLMADAASDRLRDRIGAELRELRLAATELAVDADLERGRHEELVAELSALTADHPHLERFTAQLMLALYRDARQVEALRSYQRLRAVLAEDFGVSPGPQLQCLHSAVLRHDPALRRVASDVFFHSDAGGRVTTNVIRSGHRARE